MIKSTDQNDPNPNDHDQNDRDPWRTLYYRPLHRDNWGLILVLIDINRACIILFYTNCHQFTVKWHRFIIKTCLVYMIQSSIFREINIPIEIPV